VTTIPSLTLCFAKKLTENFQEVTTTSIYVGLQPRAYADPEGPPNADDRARYGKDMERMNCGFDKVEILSQRRYLKFNFSLTRKSRPHRRSALNFLANVDAIISTSGKWRRRSENDRLYLTYLFFPSLPT